MDYLLRMARRDERRLLTGRCDIVRGTHPDVEIVHEDLPCLVLPSSRVTVELTSGGAEAALSGYDVRVPYAADVRRGDTVMVTRSADPMMAGWWTTVVEVTVNEWGTSRVLSCHRSTQAGRLDDL